MNKIKKIKLIFIITLMLLISKLLFSQGNPTLPSDINFQNTSGTDCIVQVIPVSMIMNGYGEYDLHAKYSVNQGGYVYNYNASVYRYNNVKYTATTLSGNGGGWPLWFDGDIQGPDPYSVGSIGRGIYKIIFRWYQNSSWQNDTTWFEMDGADVNNYPFLNLWYFTLVSNTAVFGGPGGIGITYQGYYPDETLGPQLWVGLTNRYIKVWDPYNDPGNRRNKDYGNFTYSTNHNNNYYEIPQDSRVDCPYQANPNNDENHDYSQDVPYLEPFNKESGNLSLNLTISKPVSDVDFNRWAIFVSDNVPNPLLFTILNGSTLRLTNNAILSLYNGPASITGYPDFLMTDKSGANLVLDGGTKIILNAPFQYSSYRQHTELLLEQGSNFTGNSGSEIQIYPGGLFCNQGANITGTLKLHYMSRLNGYMACNQTIPILNKNTQMFLDSAVLQIPDNTSIILDAGSSLILSPSSVIQFGVNSNIVLQNGAYISANNATFTSIDPNQTWDGIYLSGGNDTISNCTITNAYNGISALNKNGNTSFIAPTTQISNCTFGNTTNTQLTTGINISNSNNVLVNNNTFSSAPLIEGWASALLMQYCPSGILNIMNNSISNVTNGISVIQSSPYIANNTINGQANDGTGIYLDNSNGNIKCNTVNNFTKSVVMYYSSPYLYRNYFNNAYDINIDMYQNSAAIMNCLNDGSYLNWIGGDNYLNGNPVTCGINITDANNPTLDSGYNNITLNGSVYIQNNAQSISDYYIRMNFWGDVPPDPNRIQICCPQPYPNPFLSSITDPTTDGYVLNDIGFGLYDTVLTKNLGDDPVADNLYSQAYTNEVSGQYSVAINLYKQVVANYKTSDKAPAAIERIINCLEKKRSKISEYSQLQSYMTDIRNTSIYPASVRNLAEDFIIKCMVRQNIYPNSISSYDTMYHHNISTPKGTHALLNELSLQSIFKDTTGNHVNLHGNNQQYKLSLLSLITGKKLKPLYVTQNVQLPSEFKLYQNYPNPFNPTTKIKYDIPKTAQVCIKVYDILGREVTTLVNELKQSGSYEIDFNGTNLASGLYFYRINAGNYTTVKKMVLVK